MNKSNFEFMKNLLFLVTTLTGTLLFNRCSISRQVAEANALGNCTFNILSVDSIYLSGTDVQIGKSLEDLNPTKFPQLATSILTGTIPLSARLKIGITNPSNRTAAINQLEYKVLLANQTLFDGFVNQRIEVLAGGGKTEVPIQLNTNAYKLITDPSIRDTFANFIRNLSGIPNTKPSTITIKIKPTLTLGNKQVNYPGYIIIDQAITNKSLLGQK